MGLFDTLNCKYPLPLPSDLKEVKDINFNELKYQTKDLDNILGYYEIREDGTLWNKKIEQEYIAGNPNGKTFRERFGTIKTIKEWWEPCKFSGDISFYHSLQYNEYANTDWENDYWIEFKSIFIDGTLSKIDLVSFIVTDNTERKQFLLNLNKKLKRKEELWNKWYMKYGYFYYDSLIFNIFKFYKRFMYKIMYILPSAQKIENWLRPL